MIQEMLPAYVVAVEERRDHVSSALFPEEELVLGQAVDKRRREFTAMRACAREALGSLGIPPVAIPAGERGEPQWPTGIVGSITHCDGYGAVAVARSSDIVTLGIDAEPNAALPAGVLKDIARPEEMPWLHRLNLERPDIHWGRLLFSVKESVYKAWFPLARRWLGFEDAAVTLDLQAHAFTARLMVAGPLVNGEPLRELSGRWLVRKGIIATSIAVNAY